MDKQSIIPIIVFVAGFIVLVATDIWVGSFGYDRQSGIPQDRSEGAE
jgi:hypothetical protein